MGSWCAESVVGQRVDTASLDDDDASGILNFTVDGEKRFLSDSKPSLFEKLRIDNNVGNAGLVFEADKDKSFGSAWSLAADDHSRDMNMLSIPALRQIARQGDIMQPRANKSHRMTSRGDAGAGKVGIESFKGIHRSKRQRRSGAMH